MDEKTGMLSLQVDGGGKQRSVDLHIHDQRVNDGMLLYMLGGIGTPTDSLTTFVYDDTGLQNFINDAEWTQWEASIPQQESWDDFVTYTRFDVDITNNPLPAHRAHYYKIFGDGYFSREFTIEFEYVYRDQGSIQAQFMPFIMGEDTRLPEYFNPGDHIMAIKVDTDGNHTWERYNTSDSENIGYLVSDTHYYCRVQHAPMTPYGQSSQTLACQVSFWTNAAMIGTPAFTAYYNMSDIAYLEQYDQLAIGAAVSSGTYSFILENLWVGGATDIDSIPMMTEGHLAYALPRALKMRVTGLAFPANSYTTMMVFGGSMSGSYWKTATQPLIMPFDGTVINNMDLVVFNNERPTAYDVLPLFIGGMYPIVNNNIPLTLWHDMGQPGILPLWIGGYGSTPGYNSTTDQLLCYINRPDQSDTLPLVVYNNTPGSNSYINMRINGILGTETQSCTLVMPNTKDGSPNSFLKLQTTGGIQVVSQATLALPETLANLNANLPMVVYHSGGVPNSYVRTFIDGVYKSTGYTTLAMPNVYHIPTDNVTLYIRGY